MKKYCVFLFNAKENTLSEVLSKDLAKEDALQERKRLCAEGLPAHFEEQNKMKTKYQMKGL